jgi:16S rRNA (cytosine967-C5)-methyltransferase
MIAPARLAAYEALRMVSRGQADLPQAMVRVRGGLPDERDRALASEIVTGTLRWRSAFDHLVQHATGRPLSRLDPEVLDILRLTLFQLLYLDRVPASAAVNDAVSLVKRVGKRSAAPLVNAVLRRMSRERGHLPLPARPADAADHAAARAYLAVTLSHPEWLVDRWIARYGFDATEAWLRFDNQPAPLTLRANRLRATTQEVADALDAQGVRTEPGRFAPDVLVVLDGNPLLTPLADTGLFFVQDEASQLVGHLVNARRGERVLDVCASPGGKTAVMAASMEDAGLIVASDLRARRVDLLARTITHSRAASVRIVRADAERPLPFSAVFDAVLLDAPCSGLGILRRDPDIKWRRTEAELPALAAAQVRMLDEAAAVVRPGGRLVYATCSSEPEENDGVVDRFLADRPDFRPLLSTPVTAVAPFLDDGGRFRTLPHRHGLESFFAATLEKIG